MGGGGGEGGAERELGMEPTSEFSGWPTITTFSRKGIHVEHQSIFTILNVQHHEICWPKLLKNSLYCLLDSALSGTHLHFSSVQRCPGQCRVKAERFETAIQADR